MRKQLTKTPAIIAIAFMLLSFLDWPYGYYTFIKFVVTGVSAYYAYWLYKKLQTTNFWFWFLAATAILFNPIIPIHLGDKSLWMVIDVVAIVFLISFVLKFRKKGNKE